VQGNLFADGLGKDEVDGRVLADPSRTALSGGDRPTQPSPSVAFPRLRDAAGPEERAGGGWLQPARH